MKILLPFSNYVKHRNTHGQGLPISIELQILINKRIDLRRVDLLFLYISLNFVKCIITILLNQLNLLKIVKFELFRLEKHLDLLPIITDSNGRIELVPTLRHRNIITDHPPILHHKKGQIVTIDTNTKIFLRF